MSNLRGILRLAKKGVPDLIIMVPGDPLSTHRGDVAFGLRLKEVLSAHLSCALFGFRGHTLERRQFLMSRRWITDLLGEVSNFDGIVLVWNSLKIGLVIMAFRKILRRRYRIIYVLPYLQRQNEWTHLEGTLARKLLPWFRVRVAYGLQLLTIGGVDGVIYHAYDRNTRTVQAAAKFSTGLCFPFVDTKVFAFNETSRREIRSYLGANKFVVGVIGPFGGDNLPSVEYVRSHIREFDADITFLMIGQFDRTDSQFPQMRFVGHHVKDYIGYLSACDCVLIPRLVSSIGPLTKMVEAMSVGRAVITNNPQQMHVTNGVEVLTGSLDKLPGILNLLTRNTSKMKDLGDNARRRVIEEYSADTFVREFLPFFQAVKSQTDT